VYPEIFRGGLCNFFIWTCKFRGFLGFFSLKNPSKLKKFPKRREGWPQILPKYAPEVRTPSVAHIVTVHNLDNSALAQNFYFTFCIPRKSHNIILRLKSSTFILIFNINLLICLQNLNIHLSNNKKSSHHLPIKKSFFWLATRKFHGNDTKIINKLLHHWQYLCNLCERQMRLR